MLALLPVQCLCTTGGYTPANCHLLFLTPSRDSTAINAAAATHDTLCLCPAQYVACVLAFHCCGSPGGFRSCWRIVPPLSRNEGSFSVQTLTQASVVTASVVFLRRLVGCFFELWCVSAGAPSEVSETHEHVPCCTELVFVHSNRISKPCSSSAVSVDSGDTGSAAATQVAEAA